MTERNILDLMPDDMPGYMAPAWIAAVRWGLENRKIVDQYMTETNDDYPMRRFTPIEAMIDDATGRTWHFLIAFVQWFNENWWGSMSDTEDQQEETENAQDHGNR